MRWLAVVVLAMPAVAFAADALQVGPTYDCGAGRSRFKIVGCSGGNCDVFYVNEAAPGGGSKMPMPESQVREMISQGCRYPGQPAPTAPTAPAEKPAKHGGKRGRGEATPSAPTTSTTPGTSSAPGGPRSGGPVTLGKYECYTSTGSHLTPAMAENFELLQGGQYRDAAGSGGTYRYDASSGDLQFSGGALAGRRARFIAPTMNFLDAQGRYADACDAKGR